MGNCWGAPVDNHHSTTTTRPPSPGLSKNNSNEVAIPSTKSLQNLECSASESLEEEYPDGHILTTPNLKVYSFQELKSATRNFRPDTILGEGGFGRVFKGWVDEKTLAPTRVGTGIMVAVKKANSESMQGLEEWQSEVDFLGRLFHPNLVKLIGYCWEEKEFLLVYEFMQKGSLENHLFRRGGSAVQPLSWDIRLKIAIGAARGLAFLHASQKQVIYRDFKSSNILLDGDFNSKISDFGLAKNGPASGDSHVTTRVIGTYGYAAPEYVATGHLYVKSDVYGFGVVLLEMLTGQRAIDTNRPGGQHNLVDWAKPLLSDRRKLMPIMDLGLKDDFPVKGAVQAAQLTLKCLGPDPKSRPSMKEVLDTLEKIRSIADKPKETHPSSIRPTTKHGEGRHNGHHRSPLHSKPGNGRSY
ncbi:kinase [Thalictrum thalictroides]|uniref:non-specific serine/threonine protein kinase n=1 Tax=Thalictrum thalictroides TaxID=46969 RepID=A0A7J6X220_THATH|nr:kinase [Thalictrum thalictroides]